MTGQRAAWTLVITLCAASCNADMACITDDPFELRITARSSVTGEALNGLSGFTASGGYQRSLICVATGEQETCHAQVSGSHGAVRLERAGYLPWDTTGVRIIRVGDGCVRPIEKHLEVEMVPVGG